MRTSKKLLSFFLAVVMVVTTCSVGFTAFAQDNSNSIWNTSVEADDAFDTLDDLASEYLPSILLSIDSLGNLVYEKYAKEMGKTASELTDAEKEEIADEATISDVLYVLQPTLLELFGTSQSKFVDDYYGEDIADSLFDYLNKEDYDYDGDTTMSYYTIVTLCEKYKEAKITNTEGKKVDNPLTSEQRDQLAEWYEALYPLSELATSVEDKINEYGELFNDAYEDINGLTWKDSGLYTLEKFDFNMSEEDEAFFENLYPTFNSKLREYGIPEEDITIDSFAGIVYYFYGMGSNTGVMYKYYNYIIHGGATSVDFVGEADFFGDGEVSYDMQGITPQNFVEITGKAYAQAMGGISFDELCEMLYADYGFESAEELESYFAPLFMNYIFIEVMDENYYKEAIIGMTVVDGDVESAEAFEQLVDDYMPEGWGTEDCVLDESEISNLAIASAYMKVSGYEATRAAEYFSGTTCSLKLAVSGLDEFSLTLPDVLKDTAVADYLELVYGNYNVNSTSRNYRISLWNALHPLLQANQDSIYLKDDEGNFIYDSNGVPTVNYEDYSYIIGSVNGRDEDGNIESGTINSYFASAEEYAYSKIACDLLDITPTVRDDVSAQTILIDVTSYIESTVDTSLEVTLSDEQIEILFGDYDFTGEIGAEILNFELSDLITYYLAMEFGSTTIEGLINSLMTSNIDLITALDDVWLRLIESPVGTIVELLPALMVLVDELLEPLLLTDDDDQYNKFLYNVLNSSLITEYTLDAGSYIGIGQLYWDLNEMLPDLLHWLQEGADAAGIEYYDLGTVEVKELSGTKLVTKEVAASDVDTSDPKHYTVKDADGNELTRTDNDDGTATFTYQGESSTDLKELLANYPDSVFTYYMTYESDVPVLTGIYIADLALRDAEISDLEDMLIDSLGSETTGKGLYEIIVELADFFTQAVDEFVNTPEYRNQKRYDTSGNVLGSGLNNLFVAIPQLFDIMEDLAAEKYGNDTDLWTYCYDGKIVTNDYNSVVNTSLENFKSYVDSDDADRKYDIFDCFADIFVNDWINPILSLLNNVFATDNKLSSEIPIISGLLNALGGFTEESVLTDILNGVFQITRESEYSFTFEEQSNGFIGLNKDNAYFLIGNISRLIEVIVNLASSDDSSSESSTTSISAASLLSAFTTTADADTKSSSAAASASGYSDSDLENVTDLINNVDELLSSILSDTSLNDYTFDEADNIFASIVSTLSNYLGRDCSNELIRLLNQYLYYLNGEDRDSQFAADEDGDIVDTDVYTDENLTTLVVETFVFIEDIVEYLLDDYYDTYDIGDSQTAEYNLIVEAIEGLISPDTVQIRLSDNESVQKELASLDCWHSAVKGTSVSDVTISLDWGITDGDKDAFYENLASSLRVITSILGVLMIDTGWYESIVMPVLDALCTPNDIDVDTLEEYSANQEEYLLGIIRPVADLLNALLDQPVNTLLNSITGLAGILDDSNGATISSIIEAAVSPLADEVTGVANIVNYLSPTFATVVNEWNEDIFVKYSDASNIKINDISLSGSNLVAIINSYISSYGITLDEINWNNLSNASSPADVLVAILEYVIDVVLENDNLTAIAELIDNDLVTEIIDAIKNSGITAKDLLSILNRVLEATDNPTLVYWTFEQYLQEKVENFTYPTGISKSMAKEAVTDIDLVINNLFPLLSSLGLDLGGDTLEEILEGNLYTNSILTSLATALYGALDTNDTVKQIMAAIGVPTSTKDVAALLTDTSYGTSYSKAAKTIKKASSWSDITSLNWGFKDGSQEGFVNALVAILRPFDNLLEVFLNEGTLALNDTLYDLIYSLSFNETYEVTISDATVKFVIKMSKGVLTIKAKDADRKYTLNSTLKIDFSSLTDLKDLKIEGTNGYNSAIIPLLEAFGCTTSSIKSYKTYQSDVKSAKDNLLLDILNPIMGSSSDSLLNQIVSNPIETIATILPNIAVYLDAHGLSQALSNLLAPITEIIYDAAEALDLNNLIEDALGSSLGDYVGSLIGMDEGQLVIDLTDLTTANIEDIIIPIINTVFASSDDSSLSSIQLSDIDWTALIALGTQTTYTSKATDANGNKLTGKKLKNVDYGKTLIVVLRYVIDALKDNIKPIGSLLTSIDAIKNSDTLLTIVNHVIGQIKTHSTDQIIAAIYYFFIGETTEDYWDYTDYVTKNYSFSYPDGVTDETVSKLVSFLDGIIGELDLNSLVSDYLYTDDLINTLAELIYTNIDSVKISDSISLGDILDIFEIPTDTSSVASLLTDSSYGETKQFKKAAKKIAKASSWSKVDFDSLSWGVTDRDTFVNALVAILRPFDGVLDALLADGSLSILEGIDIAGSNAYESAIVPLLEAFQCTGIKSYKKYLSDIDKSIDSVLIDIIDPILDLVEEIIDTPIDSIASRLPNIALYIANDGIIQLVENLLTPIYALMEEIVPVLDVDKLIGELLDMDDFSLSDIDGLLGDYIGQENLIPLINSLLSSTGIELPDINWFKLASLGDVDKNATSAVKNYIGSGLNKERINVDGDTNEVLIALLRYVLDAVLDNADAIKSLIGSSYTGTLKEILDLIFDLDSDDLISLVFSLVDITQSPTEVYWAYKNYISKSISFSYPDGITASEADEAVDQLDEMVNAIFALLAGLDVVDSSDLSGLVNDLLFTNDMLTAFATTLYGALDTESIAPYLEMLGIPVSTKGVAKLLTDKSYGATYSSAAKAISSKSSWSKVTDVNWGFTDGSAKAEQGFVNAFVAILRPFIDILAPFLNGTSLELGEMLYNVIVGLEINTDSVALNDGLLEIKSNKKTVFSLDLANLDTLKKLNLYGSNAYESAIIPLLDAFQVDSSEIRTYDQYVSDCKKAKDNVLLDVLNPVVSFVDDVLEAPFDTIASVLPNVAYFLENNGVGQFVDNLLSPVTELLRDMKADGVDIDEILEIALGKDLGTLITDALGIETTLNLQLTDLSSCNIQDILLPLINSLLKSTGIKLPDFEWSTIAAHGDVVTSSSKAENAEGTFTNKEVIADRGEVLIAVLRYLAKTIVNNAGAIKDLLCSIDAIANSDMLSAIIKSIFNTLSISTPDAIVLAIFYFLTNEPTNAFWDYTGYETGTYEFVYPDNMDTDFLTNLAPMLDGLIVGLIDLNGLVSEALFTDDIISSLTVGLYSAIEGVSISDSMTLTDLLAMTDIDFSTDNVAALLVDEDYGQTYSSAASVISAAGSWSNVDKDSLKWGVTDRDSFFHALVAVLRPMYGVLDVLLNDASLGLFDIVRLPGSNGYTSSIVPLMEAFSMYNIKTQYQYREDINEEYDAILLDIINPLWDWVEDLLAAPIQVLAEIIPNLALFIGNDGLCQIIDNLLTPVSALIDAIEPVVDLNDLLDVLLEALDVDLDSLLAQIGITNFSLDLYDLNATLKPLLGGDAIIPLINNILGLIEIGDVSLGLTLNDVDWLQLASHGETYIDASQAATYGSRIYVVGDVSETLIAVLRYLVDTINAGDNFDVINDLIAGLLGDVSDSVADMINEILGMLIGDTDEVIFDLVDLLQTLGG
ncbi:MAG: hypothetical protein LIO62_02585 [Clostridiales bacterium]|nr:hypothetical protein [Clostridiales bacterium]